MLNHEHKLCTVVRITIGALHTVTWMARSVVDVFISFNNVSYLKHSMFAFLTVSYLVDPLVSCPTAYLRLGPTLL